MFNLDQLGQVICCSVESNSFFRELSLISRLIFRTLDVGPEQSIRLCSQWVLGNMNEMEDSLAELAAGNRDIIEISVAVFCR